MRANTLFTSGATALNAVLLTAALATPAQAARPKSKVLGAIIVINGDPGGSVRDRYGEIQQINRSTD